MLQKLGFAGVQYALLATFLFACWGIGRGLVRLRPNDPGVPGAMKQTSDPWRSHPITITLALEFWRTGLVPRLPTAVLAVGVMLTAMLAQVCGAILHTVTLGRQEAKRLVDLSISAPVADTRASA